MGTEKERKVQGVKDKRSRSNFHRDEEYQGFEESEMEKLERAHMEYLNKI